MPKQANGFDRNDAEEDRHKLVPTTDAQPIPAATGARVHTARTSIAGRYNDLAAHHTILSTFNSKHQSLSRTMLLH